MLKVNNTLRGLFTKVQFFLSEFLQLNFLLSFQKAKSGVQKKKGGGEKENIHIQKYNLRHNQYVGRL